MSVEVAADRHLQVVNRTNLGAQDYVNQSLIIPLFKRSSYLLNVYNHAFLLVMSDQPMTDEVAPCSCKASRSITTSDNRADTFPPGYRVS